MASDVVWYILNSVREMWARYLRSVITTALVVSTATVVAQGLASADGVYDSSTTPSSLPWNTYNYCNAPHVNAAHYTRPNVTGAKLVYMNAVIRHHKVRAWLLSSTGS